ncbi:uncharacterized protein LOC131164781 [Malania oleifera]|uniref:uncharacterized protein LOC131164781 n=1 Tax=Malania oleifera TaxID=397392 RepID=UPI0025AE5B49|nr:uncharacterized protein LOC131164781 [Malania oleifera]
MENGQNMNALRMQDGFITNPFDQRAFSKSDADLMVRRLKNRERQRRYRARKRLEADAKRSCIVNQSTALQAEMGQSGMLNNRITRVHCVRNWKKDARRAHASKKHEGASRGPLIIPALTLASESLTPCLPSGTLTDPTLECRVHSESSPSLVNCETDRVTLSRRDWKADARKKKN